MSDIPQEAIEAAQEINAAITDLPPAEVQDMAEIIAEAMERRDTRRAKDYWRCRHCGHGGMHPYDVVCKTCGRPR